jgi:hypothetical protein
MLLYTDGFTLCLIYRAAGKSVAFAECTQESQVLALSCKRLSLQLNTSRLRGEALNLVRKSNKRIIYDEEGVKIESKQGNAMF